MRWRCLRSVALLVGAFYLRRRRRVAWQVALALLCGLTILDIVKGLDVEEAALTAAGAALLWWGRDAFVREGRPGAAPLCRSGACPQSPSRRSSSASPPSRSPRRAPASRRWLNETFELLTWQPGELRLGDEGGHLPLALGLLGLVALGSAAWLVFRPLAAPRALPDPEVRHAVEELVRRHGHDTLAFFKLRGDKHYLFTDDGAAFLGLPRRERRDAVSPAIPSGRRPRCRSCCDKAAAFAEVRGLRLAAVAVSARAAPASRRSACGALYLGDEAIVETAGSRSRAARSARCASP